MRGVAVCFKVIEQDGPRADQAFPGIEFPAEEPVDIGLESREHLHLPSV